MPIRVLDAETIGRIAAGEVVERPASIAKELIENSLDAGATSITVEIRDGGCSYLRVTDNGCGIPAEEARLAFENHATSKISSGDELSDILTLGFRGEALPSISAVSKVTMTTRQKGKDAGIRVRVEGGMIQDVSAAGCPEGTSIVVQDLFFNTPVRKAFLKKPATEGGVVADMVARLILGNPSVSIRLISNGKNVYHSYGDGDMRHAALAVYGRNTAEKLKFFDETEGSIRIWGLIGVGELGKSNRSHQFFFINGRVVRSPLMTQSLEVAARTLVTIGQHPMCAINLRMPAHAVDINVHPSKLEVRFRDDASVRIYAESMLYRALISGKMLEPETAVAQPAPVAPRASVRVQPSETTPVQHIHAAASSDSAKNISSVSAPAQKPESISANALQSRTAPVQTFVMPAEKNEAGQGGGAPEASEKPQTQSVTTVTAPKENAAVSSRTELTEEEKAIPPSHPVEAAPAARAEQASAAEDDSEELTPIIIPAMHGRSFREESPALSVPSGTSHQPPPDLSVYRRMASEVMEQMDFFTESPAVKAPEQKIQIIGVFANTYILVEYKESLILIDQHAAHERIRYEEYEKALHQGHASQQLLTPIILSLSARERSAVLSHQELLADVGYEIEPFGERDIQVRAVPYILGQAELRPLFLEMIDRLDQLKGAAIDRRRSEVIQASCKRAVKAGDRLTHAEVQALVDEMLRTDAPPTCPHGRPVLKVFRKNEIERMFKRI